MASFNIASTAIVTLINFLTIPIFTRMLGTEGYGIVTIYLAWVQIFTVFVGLKVDGSIGSASANLEDSEQDSYQFSILLLAVLSFVIISSVVFLFLEPLSSALKMSRVLVAAMVLQSFGAFVVAFFSMRFIFQKKAQKNFLISVGLCIATTVLSIALIMLVYKGADAYLGRVVGLAVPNIVLAVVFIFWMVLRKEKHFALQYWRFCLSLTVPLIFHGLSQFVLSQTGKIVVQYFYGDSLAGLYGLSVTILGLMAAIYMALNNAFVPFMYDDLAGKTSKAIKQRHFQNYFVLFTLGSCAFALVSPEILRVMSTETFWSAADILPILVVGQYCVFLYSFPVNYEFYKAKTVSVAIGTTLAAAINLILVFVMVPRWGLWGAAIATAVSYLVLFIFHLCIARYRLGDKNYPVVFYALGLCAVFATAMLGIALAGLAIIRWVLGLLLFALAVWRIWQAKSIF